VFLLILTSLCARLPRHQIPAEPEYGHCLGNSTHSIPYACVDLYSLEQKRLKLVEEANVKNGHLKTVIDQLRHILNAIDNWNE
jgi:hypothetical protein